MIPLPSTKVLALEATAVVIIPAHAHPSVVPVQEVTPTAEVNALVTLAG